MQSKLDLLPLEKVVMQLKKNYRKAENALAHSDMDDFDSFRTACIKGFELVFELGRKFIRRGLEEAGEDVDSKDMEYRFMLRLETERGIIPDPEIWYSFRQERNRTAHTYDEKNRTRILSPHARIYPGSGSTAFSAEILMHMAPEHFKIVREILQFYLPRYEVRAFGSRVHGRHLKKFSDLDLAVMTDAPLPLKDWARAKDAFEVSDLPFRVDLVDWAATSENFRKIIEENCEVIHTPGTVTFTPDKSD